MIVSMELNVITAVSKIRISGRPNIFKSNERFFINCRRRLDSIRVGGGR